MTSVHIENIISTIRKRLIGDGFEFVLDIENSHGNWMRDALTGRDILDFYSCFASNPLGFNHPKMRQGHIVNRLTQAALHNVTNSDLFTSYKAEFVETFFNLAAPPDMKYMFLVAGGALAVENALKASFDWKSRLNRKRGDTRNLGTKVLHLRKAFHGRSGYTMSLTNTEPGKTEGFPKFDWPRIDNPHINFPDEGEAHEDLLRRERRALEQAKHAILTHGIDIAACIIEPIQGEGGDNQFRGEFLRKLQTLCSENDIMFIVDEIQTGIGLTGKMWAIEHYGLKPDMLCFGKKSQVCGFICTDKIDSVEDHVFQKSGRINSTWGGNLVDMIRCQHYLEIIEEDNLVDNAARVGKALLAELIKLQGEHPDIISNTRGKGLMCAFDLPTPDARDKLRIALFEEGVLIMGCGVSSIRFRPGLTISEEEVVSAVDTIGKTLGNIF